MIYAIVTREPDVVAARMAHLKAVAVTRGVWLIDSPSEVQWVYKDIVDDLGHLPWLFVVEVTGNGFGAPYDVDNGPVSAALHGAREPG